MSSEKNPDTRSRSLNAAWTLLEGGGPARMSDIAKAAGISRQALYLHFPNRADLLVATVRHIDEANKVDARLAGSGAASGVARLDAWIADWGGYIPEIHGVARALMAMPGDAEAAAAWADRMEAVHHGCRAAVAAVAAEGRLADDLTEPQAADLLWALLSVETWEKLVRDKGWSQADYLAAMIRTAHGMLLGPEPGS